MSKKDFKGEFTQKMEWLREFLDGPHSTYEGDGLEFTESLTADVNSLIGTEKKRIIQLADNLKVNINSDVDPRTMEYKAYLQRKGHNEALSLLIKTLEDENDK